MILDGQTQLSLTVPCLVGFQEGSANDLGIIWYKPNFPKRPHEQVAKRDGLFAFKKQFLKISALRYFFDIISMMLLHGNV